MRALLALLAVATLSAADTRVLEAVKRRDPAAVAALLRDKADVNAALADGSTALSWAAYFNDSESSDLLLKAGAKADIATEYGETPLTLACSNGNAILVGKLLQSGASTKAAR